MQKKSNISLWNEVYSGIKWKCSNKYIYLIIILKRSSLAKVLHYFPALKMTENNAHCDLHWDSSHFFNKALHCSSINYMILEAQLPGAFVVAHCLYLCPQRAGAAPQPLIWALCHCAGLQQHTMSALFSAEVPQLGPLGMLSAQLSLILIIRRTAGSPAAHQFTDMQQRCHGDSLLSSFDFIFSGADLWQEQSWKSVCELNWLCTNVTGKSL